MRKKAGRKLRAAAIAAAAITGATSASAPAAVFDIVLNPGAGLSANAPALAAFNRAANAWENVFHDPITVTINANLQNLGSSSIIGSTSNVYLEDNFDNVRAAMVADAFNSSTYGLTSHLPTLAQFSAFMPSGFSLDGGIASSKANLKAMGYTGLDGAFGAADGTMTFNSNFAFDYDASNGITPGQMDFQLVATHEIGHLLGFTSIVDIVGQVSPQPLPPFALDLFRFQNGGSFDPTTMSDFTNFPRDLVPGHADIFDDLTNEYLMSTVSDGRQASHWKDDALIGSRIGIMDPTLNFGATYGISSADIRALDLIGWDLPEPSAACIFVLSGFVFLPRRAKRAQKP